MNIQTEHLEKNIARFTVDVPLDRIEQAKKKAARKIAKQVNIPGFRKGKAPYHMIARYVGEPAILEEAIEELGQEVYREALDESGIEPYGPGQMEDFKLDPEPQFIYTVPKQPSVELNAYREVRVEFEAPEVTDEDVDRQLELLAEQEALVEPSEKPIEVGNRVTFDIDSYFVDEEEDKDDEDEAETDETEVDEEADSDEIEDDDDDDFDESVFIVREGLKADLKEGDDEPIAPGFTGELLGASVGDVRTFDLTFPDNEDVDEEVRGRTVHFEVNIKEVETVTVPELNDELAGRFTERFAKEDDEKDEEGNPVPLTLLQLRMRIRENLEKSAEEHANNEYADKVLDEMVEIAETHFPEMMVHDQIHQMIDQLDQQLRNQGLSLEMYQQITGKSHADLHDDYHENAEQMIRRSLVLSQVVMEEKLRVTDEEIEAHIDSLARQFGGGDEQLEAIKQTLQSPSMIDNIVNRMVQDKAFDRIIEIGKGEAPDLEEIEEAEETGKEAETEAVKAEAEVSEEATAEAETSTEEEASSDEDTADSNGDDNDTADED